MKTVEQWFTEHVKNKKFLLSMFVSLVVMFGLTAEFTGFQYSILKIIRYLMLLFGLFFIAWIDGECHKIPNAILMILVIARLVLLVSECLVYSPAVITLLISAVMGVLTGTVLFGSCYLISHGGIGAGDVKLFMVIGFYTGTNVVMAIAFLSVCVAAVYSIVLWGRKKIGLKQTIPFGPFVFIGAVIAFAMGV